MPVTKWRIHVDGRIDEGIWQRAVPLTGFKQRDPQEGADASVPTEVRLVFDATALYVAVRADDADPAKIVGHLTRRDRVRRLTGFAWSSTRSTIAGPATSSPSTRPGSSATVLLQRRQHDDDGWDAVWDVATLVTDEAGRPSSGSPSRNCVSHRPRRRVGFAVFRAVPASTRSAPGRWWPGAARASSRSSATSATSRPGARRGVSSSMPYAVAELDDQSVGGRQRARRPPDPSAAVGLDLKYALSPASR